MTESEKYFDYLQMLRKPFQKLCRLRFLQPDGTTAFALDNRRDGARSGAFIADGTITHNWQNGRRTNVTVTIENTDGEFDYDFNTVWFGQEIALDEGLILSDGETEFYIQQGVFLIEEPEEMVQPNRKTATYHLVDKVAALDGSLGGNLEGTYQVEAGTNIFVPITALLAEDRGNGYPVDRVNPVFTEYYNGMTQDLPDGSVALMTDAPYTLTVEGGQSKWNVIEGLAAMVNAWVGYDETGALRIDPSQDDILDTDKPVEWEFSMDEAELLGMTYTDKNTEVYNDYIVVGELLSDNAQPTGRAQIFDSRSPVAIDVIGRKTIRVSKAGYGTNTQCRDYANFMIKRSSIARSAVSISCSQIFHIRGNQLITLTRTDKTGHPTERHLVQGFSRPLAASGAMTITATSTQDIEIASVASVSTFRFVSDSIFTLATGNGQKNWNGRMEYSFDAMTWDGWSGITTIEAKQHKGEYCIYLRGTGNTKISGVTDGGFVLTGSDIRCEGNIEILLDDEMTNNGFHPPMEARCFLSLFSGNASIVSAPILGATTLSDGCYISMFQDCTNLTEAPSLPATKLAASCYWFMFAGCTSLTTAPALPATKLETACYMEMFQDCTGLVTPPRLPAVAMTSICYEMMFAGCTALTTAPELPATTLATDCYNNMFSDCYALVAAPPLPAMVLAEGCYSSMFGNCTALAEAPALPAMTLADSCYTNMFFGCTALTVPPELPATTLASGCYRYMFRNCTGLTELPALPALNVAYRSYYEMFSGCTGIKLSATRTGEYQKPYRIPTSGTGTTATDALYHMFAGTGGTFTGTPAINTTYYLSGGEAENPYLTFSSPNSFTLSVANATKNWDGTLESSTDNQTWTVWDGTITLSSAYFLGSQRLYIRGSGNTRITGERSVAYRWVLSGSQISCSGDIRNLLDYTDKENTTMSRCCFMYLFYNCSSLISAPDLPSMTLSAECYSYMFYGCSQLTTAPELPATDVSAYYPQIGYMGVYSNMFRNCSSLTTAPALPATTLGMYCYYYMFAGCTSLVSPPELPATSISGYSYAGMFYGCTSLATAPELPATSYGDYSYNSMFYNCTSLEIPPSLPQSGFSPSTSWQYIFASMFYGCRSLKALPKLPNTRLADYCYNNMFRGCTAIKLSTTQIGEYQTPYRIPFSGTGSAQSHSLNNMFSGTGGTFTGTPTINTTYYTSNTIVA